MSRSYVSGWCRPRKRMAIYIRDGFACCYCGKDLRFSPSRELSLDHLTPKVSGGNNNGSNLITACHECNSHRQDMPWQQFVRDMYGYDAMWRISYIESQVHLPLNFELVDDLLNQRRKEERREDAKREA